MDEKQLAVVRDYLNRLQTDKRYFSIAVYAIEGDNAVRIAEAGESCGQCNQVDLYAGNIGLVARTGKLHSTRDVSSDPSYRSCFVDVRSEITAPIIYSGNVVGIVDVEFDASHPLAERDELEITSIAEQLISYFEAQTI